MTILQQISWGLVDTEGGIVRKANDLAPLIHEEKALADAHCAIAVENGYLYKVAKIKATYEVVE